MRGAILVTGGAGYVGSHVCLALAEAGYLPVAYDNLHNGHAAFVQWGPLEEADIRDAEALDRAFARHSPLAVIHMAGLIEVGESVRDPGAFFEVNVGGSIQLLRAAARAGVGAFVFSSTCATYGAPVRMPMDEDHPQTPLNPYGASKLMVERMLCDLGQAGQLRSVALRYFNAAGADAQGRIGERHHPETHAIPLAIDAALGRREAFTLFGTDYETPDGTAVRDYVHVSDLADAHVLALDRVLNGPGPAGGFEAFNLGLGTGVSVRELVGTIGRMTARPAAPREAARRAGDAASLVADNRRAGAVLGWKPKRDLETIVASALAWARADGIA